jgi:hypothetical protein
MSLPVLMALWAFMRAHPNADFDGFAAAYHRTLALVAKQRERGDA